MKEEQEAAMITILTGVAALVVGALIGAVLGFQYRRRVAEAEVGSAEQEAKRIVSEAMKAAENRKKEALVEAKDEIFKLRQEAEKELKERRNELKGQERRAQQKEENLDRKTANLERKEESLNEKLRDADKRLNEAEQIKSSQFEMLERISGYTAEQAKEYLLQNLENELTREKAVKINQYTQSLREDADSLAREVVSRAIQRCAAEHVAEATVSVVALPNDEMKGRIIGREGRNIRTLETLTGVDLIIDDTPEAITLSSFDPRPPGDCPPRARKAHQRRPHPSRPHRGDGREGPPGRQSRHQAGGRTGDLRGRHPSDPSRAGQAARPAALPHQLRAECAQPLARGLQPRRYDGRRAGARPHHRQAGRPAA